MSAAVLLVSPVHNEAAHIERVVAAVARQTVPPALWLVVDDASTDDTATILWRQQPHVPFLRVLQRRPEALTGKDRLAGGAAPRAFNWGLARAGDLSRFTHVGKLDGDIELPPDYFERLLERFAADPRLGLAGGRLVERRGGRFKQIRIPSQHVHGALKLYRTDCLEAIGGLQPRLGWDSIDQTYARMRGWDARSFEDVVAVHHRHWGSAQGRLRGRARHGACAWIGHQPPSWALLRAIKLSWTPPVGLSGGAFLGGYVLAALRRTPRLEDEEFRRFVRRELRGRLVAGRAGPIPRPRKYQPVPGVGDKALVPATQHSRAEQETAWN
jgi:biofilm PGA synthesis N-glycosyltransferase PgaC